MYKGYAGKILRVNLTTLTCSFEDIDPTVARNFVGGAGFAAEVLFRELKAGVDPLSPENKLIFATSPLTSNLVPGGGSTMVCFKSPATNGWGESRVGGNFGPDMRKAGVDHIIFEGKSEKPVYLVIENGTPRLEDASDIYGKDVYEKTDILEARHKDKKKPSVMTIGQAGENLVLFASVMYRDRAAGRNGGGAVMGSKNLLAVVVSGNEKTEHADPAAFKSKTSECLKMIKSGELAAGFNEFGTVGDMAANDEDGDWPTKNWRSNSWGKGAELLDHFQEKNLIRSNQCYSGCPIGCGRVCEVKEGEFKTPEHEGAEYETMSVFTSYVMNENVDLAVHCDYLCNKYGIDTISSGAMIAFAMDCYENNVLSKEELDGLDLTWGNTSVMPILIEKMVFRDGIGDLLAKGVKKVAEIIGKNSEEFAIHVKGLEGPAHDPRSGKLLGVAYGTANRGMCHIHPLEGMAFDRGKMNWGMMEHGVSDPEQCDRWDEKGKGTDCALLQRGLILPDILTTCKFMSYAGITPELWLDMLNATTGFDMTVQELIQVGERSHNLQRLFNMREGMRRADDMLPKRCLSMPEFGKYHNDPNCVISNYDELLDEYYIANDWNLETGIPSDKKIKELSLDTYWNTYH